MVSSSILDGDPLGLALGGLGQRHRQDAVVVFGLDLVLVEPRGERDGLVALLLAIFAGLSLLVFGFRPP